MKKLIDIIEPRRWQHILEAELQLHRAGNFRSTNLTVHFHPHTIKCGNDVIVFSDVLHFTRSEKLMKGKFVLLGEF